MRKYLVRSVALGLSIVASLALAAPAKAGTMWKNYSSHNSPTPHFLSLSSTVGSKGTALVIHTDVGLTNDFWNWSSAGSGFLHILPYAQPLGSQLFVGVTTNNMSNGTALITWTPTGALNQDWAPGPNHYDENGALCYVFFNRANMSKVMGVSANQMTQNRPVIIWDYLADPTNHGDQFWCAYANSPNGPVAQVPPPF